MKVTNYMKINSFNMNLFTFVCILANIQITDLKVQKRLFANFISYL